MNSDFFFLRVRGVATYIAELVSKRSDYTTSRQPSVVRIPLISNAFSCWEWLGWNFHIMGTYMFLVFSVCLLFLSAYVKRLSVNIFWGDFRSSIANNMNRRETIDSLKMLVNRSPCLSLPSFPARVIGVGNCL